MYSKDLMSDALAHSEAKPQRERFRTSYVARLSYRGEAPSPLGANGVEGAVDLHCHAMPGQQNPLEVAKKASLGGAGGLLFKGIFGEEGPAAAARAVAEELAPWCEEHGVEPVPVRAGIIVGYGNTDDLAEAPAKVRECLEDGGAAVWMPVFTHANTLMTVATRSYEPGHVANAAPIRER
ncbi:MAG TPA: hypothetical protein VI759_06075, partial [Dehalococcoidia bacterium]|nr:hypothetical protein [Dehalococcoidia bacterium]